MELLPCRKQERVIAVTRCGDPKYVSSAEQGGNSYYGIDAQQR
jgi:hypothetical protein